MSLLDKLQVGLSAIADLTVLFCCVLSWNAMTARTKHCFRLTYGALGFFGFGLFLLPAFPGYAHLQPWFWLAMGISFAAYLALDRRRIDRVNSKAGPNSQASRGINRA